MNKIRRQKMRLLLNLILTVVTFLALIVSMVAWFSTRQQADIESIHLEVERQEVKIVKQPNSFLFPCATKISDVSKDSFNNDCCIVETYEIAGDGQVTAYLDSKNGVLAYVLDDTEQGTDYYTIITEKLKEHLHVTDLSTLSYDDLYKALNEINTSRLVGTPITSDGSVNTQVKIVFWSEYDLFMDKLNNADLSYYEVDKANDRFEVKVTFVI